MLTLLALALTAAAAPPKEGDFTVTSVSHDSHGNAYVVSYYEGDMNEQLLVMKLDRDGEILWRRSLADQDFGTSVHVSVDALGGAVVSGTFTGTIVIGDTQLESVDGRDLFVMRFTHDGEFDWSRRLSSPTDNGTTPNGDHADEADQPSLDGRLRVVIIGGGWGQVWVDGQPIDAFAPFSAQELRPGVHQVLVENPVLGTQYVEDVVVTGGQTTTVHVPQQN